MRKKLLIAVVLVNCLAAVFYFYPELTTARTIVLCFHRIETQKPFKHKWSITEEHFRKILDYLVRNEYKTLSCQEVIDFLEGNRGLPERSVLLTFDDAAFSHARFVVPELEKRKQHGVFFAHGKRLKAKEELEGDDAKALLAGGEIQSHGFSHSSMAMGAGEVDGGFESRMEQELLLARKNVKDLSGKEPTTLAYPGGDWSKALWPLLKRQGFKIAFTIEYGYITADSQPYELPRLVVTDDNDLEQLAVFLEGGRQMTKGGALLSSVLTLLCIGALVTEGKSVNVDEGKNGRQVEN